MFLILVNEMGLCRGAATVGGLKLQGLSLVLVASRNISSKKNKKQKNKNLSERTVESAAEADHTFTGQFHMSLRTKRNT